MHEAIAQSCDVYFYHVGTRGIDAWRSFYALRPSPAHGIDVAARSPGSCLAEGSGERSTGEAQTWFPGETVIVGIGQGYLLPTPAARDHRRPDRARGGTFAPRMVRAIRDTRTGATRRARAKPLPVVAPIPRTGRGESAA